MTTLRTLLLAAACAGLLGCGDSLTTPLDASTLAGSWTRLDEVPGSSERWTLAVSGGVVTGSGTWSGEACCSGTLTVSGSIARDSLHVDVTLLATAGAQPGWSLHEHFDGTLDSPTMLVGLGAFQGGTASPVRMQKVR